MRQCMFSGQKCIKNNLKLISLSNFTLLFPTSQSYQFPKLKVFCYSYMHDFGIILDFPALSGSLEEGKERHTVVDWWQAEQWKRAVRNLSSQEMGGRPRPAAMFLTWLTLGNVEQSRMLPLKGLMSHSLDSYRIFRALSRLALVPCVHQLPRLFPTCTPNLCGASAWFSENTS